MTTKPNNDHDLLIRLEAKLDQVILDVKDLKDGTTMKIANLELRVNELEDCHKQIDPPKMSTRLNSLEDWVMEQKINIKWLITIASFIGGIAGYIISQVGKWL